MNQPFRPVPKNDRRRGALPGWVGGVLLGAFVLVAGFSAFLIFTSVKDFVAGWAITDVLGPGASAAAAASAGGSKGNGGGSQAASPTSAPGALHLQKWSGTDRVTVLLTGIDYRAGITCEQQGTASRTDSIMLATVDPVAMTAAVLSIPRDLWVNIPGYGNDSINTANFRGDAYSYPGGGPALAVRTIEYNFGVHVDYYVRLDFTAFEKLIDALGGIDIVNKEDIDDEQYPDTACGFDPFRLSAGPHHLNGHDALRYARTRHNSTDIARGERQQEVVLAVLKKVKDPALLPGLLAQAPGLYQSLNQNVRTNLTLDQIVQLGLLVKDIPLESVRHEVIDYQYVQDYTTPDGRQVLLPWWDKIRALRDSIFTTSTLKPHTTPGADNPALLASEAAKVQVLNGAGVQGLAQATADYLKTKGLTVVSVGTADRTDYATTIVVDYTGKPYTSRWLAGLFNVPEGNILSSSAAGGAVDVKVILGQDWKVPAATSP
jgi:LCP family protein required for cell wall assembly